MKSEREVNREGGKEGRREAGRERERERRRVGRRVEIKKNDTDCTLSINRIDFPLQIQRAPRTNVNNGPYSEMDFSRVIDVI